MFENKYEKFTFIGLGIMLVVFLPVGNLLGFVSPNTISLWGRYFCFAIAAIGIDLIWGYTGILSMCQAFFFCLGGYSIAMHMLLSASGKGNYGAAIPDFMVWNGVEKLPWFWEAFHSFVPSIFFALLVPALLSGIFGYFVFRSRLKGVYFAIITQALALAMWLIFLRNETMLGGTNGLTDFKVLLGFNLTHANVKLSLYMISLTVLIVTYFLCYKLVKSKFGKVLTAIRDSESRVGFTAYHVKDYKLAIFVLASILAAIGGILYVPQTGIITPGLMDVTSSVEMVMWVALGGRGKLKGAIVGALLVNFIYSICTSMFPGSWLYILGILFILTVLFFQKGFMGLFELNSKDLTTQH
ncbi:MAG: urea ABC transporter permease subunit UrtC [Opitutaceae bacterium]|nr:urea ABC transporter permease subunit UrtC [Cytophagales bacterium]